MLPYWPQWAWLVVAAAVAVALCYALWLRAVRQLGRLRELHHVHYAPPLLALGAFLMWRGWVGAGMLALLLAVWVAADDALQHREQLRTPNHRSFLHRLAHRVGLI